MRMGMVRFAVSTAAALCLSVLVLFPALAQDNYGYRTTTLSGTATNYGTIETSGDVEFGMSSVAGETSTNAASGSIVTSGDSSYGIRSEGSGSVVNAGSIVTSGNRAAGRSYGGVGIYSSGSGTLYNSGSIATTGDSSSGIIWNGTIYNSGSITTSGNDSTGIITRGTLYNSGSISTAGAGGHAISATGPGSEVHLLTGTRILAGNVYGRNASSKLFLDGSGTVDFDIVGTWANLSKTGSGTWAFDRAVAGTINALNLSDGTLAVASGVGLNVSGNYVQTAGSTLLVAPDGVTTPLTITGTATLAGTLDLGASANNVGTTFTILTAGGGLGGTTFDNVASANPHFFLAVQYPDANTVTVATSYDPQWDASSLGVSTTVAATQTFAGVSTARGFELLAAREGSGSAWDDGPILVASAGSLEGLLNPAQDDGEPLWGAYLKPMFAWTSRQAESGSIGYDSAMSGFEIGLDRFVCEEVFLGVMAGYASTSLDFTGAAFASGDTEDQHMLTLGLYGGWGSGPWRVTEVLSLGRVDHQSSRNAGLGQIARADYTSWLLANQIQVAYVWVPAGGWEIAPRLGLDVAHVWREGFEEYGAVNAVRYDDFDQTFWEGSLGLRAARAFQAGNATITPYAGVGYSRDLGGNDVTVRQYLGGTSARVTTENDDHRLTTEAGLTLAAPDKTPLALTLAYDGEFSDNTESHGLTATLRWEF